MDCYRVVGLGYLLLFLILLTLWFTRDAAKPQPGTCPPVYPFP